MFLYVLYLMCLDSLHVQNMFFHLPKEFFSQSLRLIHVTQRRDLQLCETRLVFFHDYGFFFLERFVP